MSAAVTKDRDALYYPYIHIRDANWLKATLLCFPRVHRIVPSAVVPEDTPEISAFTKLKIDQGDQLPLLAAAEPEFDYGVHDAHLRLLERVRNDPLILDRFTWDATLREFGAPCFSFRIHYGKVNYELMRFFLDNRLAWDESGEQNPHSDWYFLHPTLGEAVMSTVAIAFAEHWGSDIVTDEGRIHRALANLDEEDVYSSLAGGPSRGSPKAPGLEEVTDELAMLFMTTAFDLGRLTPQQILELKRERKDLRRFKDRVQTIAERVVGIPDPNDRQVALRPYVEELLDQWQAYRQSLPVFAKQALVDAAKLDGPGLGSAALAGSTAYAVAGQLGLAVGLLLFSGHRIVRSFQEKRDHPYQYLSRIDRKGATLVLTPRRPGAALAGA